MVCKHKRGDPKCTSGKSPKALWDTAASALRVAQWYSAMPKEYEGMFGRGAAPVTPDASEYEILKAETLHGHLILCVRYPSCASCAYEGVKVMVYGGISYKDALYWREIDPHFADPSGARAPYQAPPPVARFPGSDEGWERALAFVRVIPVLRLS